MNDPGSRRLKKLVVLLAAAVLLLAACSGTPAGSSPAGTPPAAAPPIGTSPVGATSSPSEAPPSDAPESPASIQPSVTETEAPPETSAAADTPGTTTMPPAPSEPSSPAPSEPPSDPAPVTPSALPAAQTQEPAVSAARGQVTVSLTYKHRGGIASNQFAVWIENGEGELIKTLFVTRFTGNGGWEQRPDCVPVWVLRSGLSAGTASDVDAYTGATPKSGQLSYVWDCTDASGRPVPEGEYRFFVEGTIFWKDAVLFEGVIRLGGGENSAQAEARYTTEEAAKSDMISGVAAVYRPI